MKKWKKLFNKSALQNGQEYFVDDKVLNVTFVDSEKELFTARVKGSRWDGFYTVEGTYKQNGEVSDLYCSCPWADTGNLCKHMVAVLSYIDFERSQNKNGNKISIVDQLNYRYQDRIKSSKLHGNPLHIIKDMTFSREDYHEAANFWRTVYVRDHKFDVKGNEYLFLLTLAHGYIEYKVEMNFDSDGINKLIIKSPVPINNQNTIAIAGLRKFIEFFVKEDPMQATNASARELINSFNIQYKDEEPLIFRAQIERDYGDFYLHFKMGTPNHLYKLQNLSSVVDHMRNGNPLKLGKFFNRSISIGQMDKDSQKWYHFIEDLVDTNDVLAEARSTYGYSYLSLKELAIAPNIADKIDQLLRDGAPLYDRTRKVKYEVEQTILPMTIEADSHGNSAVVKIGEINGYDNDSFIRGNTRYYRYTPGVWTRLDGVDLDYLDQIGIFQKDRLVFGSDTIQVFGRKILPKLAESGNFEIKGQKELEESLPPEAEIIFRLDLVDTEVVLQAIAKYGDDEYQLMQKVSDGVLREFDQEQAASKLITEIGFLPTSNNLYKLPLENGSATDYLLDEGLKRLKEAGIIEVTASFKRLLGNIKSKLNVNLGVRLSENTLNLEVSGDKLTPEDVQSILNAYHEKRHYFLLKNGEMRKVDSPSVKSLAALMKKMGISLDKFVKGKMTLPAYRAFYLEKQLQKRDNLTYTSNSVFDKLINDIEKGTQDNQEIPFSLTDILRPYQKQGFEWLTTLIHYNLGALLADEMGLGKTLQIISVLLQRQALTNVPSLIIVPASVVYNWKSEIEKFAPNLKTLVIDGTKQERVARLAQAKNVNILITSYDSLKRDIKDYQDLKFDLEVIDEAQNIKNAKTAVAKSVKIINADHRIALTGTPIENNLSELWSIFDYLMPGFLGKYDYFKNNYEKPIVKEGDQRIEKELSQIVSPFILRRLKKDVLKDLPSKDEKVVYVKMSGKQNELYQAQAQNLLNQLNSQDDQEFKKSRFQVLAGITKLRELCCDPHLLYDNYRGKSAKVTATLDLVQNSLKEGHKLLLFSQFTSMLEIIKTKLEKLGITIFLITGATPKQKRQELIKRFNALDRPAVFLISLKAGGTGINLTSADVVVHVDPWWNSAAENQATDRAHRIGQKHNVQVYKMVAQNTIEEKIIKLQESKSKLAEAVLSGESIGSSSLKREDLLKILER